MKKKVLALLMAATMAFAMPVAAFAAEDTTSSTTLENHDFKAYQIFDGKYSDGKLTDASWAVTDETVQNTIKTALGLNTTAELDEVLAALPAASQDTVNTLASQLAQLAVAGNLGDGIAVENGTAVKAGYYIIVDMTADLTDGDTKNFALLECPDGTITITDKHDTVTSDKKVLDVNDSNENDPTSVWGVSADYDIGDDVPFELTGTLPATGYDYYDTFEFVFHDTEATGLSFNGDVKVYLNSVSDAAVVDASYYEVKTGLEDGCTFEVVFDDVTEFASAGDTIIVRYTSKLTSNAVIGNYGNENKMYLEYSNNPNAEGTGTTTEKKVLVFTYQINVNKVAETENGEYLTGADFALYKLVTSYDGNDAKNEENVYGGVTYNKLIKTVKAENGYQFSFKGLDDGEYLLVETTTPDGYNTMESQAFSVVATHDGTEILSLNGTVKDGVVNQITFTPNRDAGTLTSNVVNKSGSLLPSTGGIGTTIFYVIGGILVVGAGVLLFTKKRVEK